MRILHFPRVLRSYFHHSNFLSQWFFITVVSFPRVVKVCKLFMFWFLFLECRAMLRKFYSSIVFQDPIWRGTEQIHWKCKTVLWDLSVWNSWTLKKLHFLGFLALAMAGFPSCDLQSLLPDVASKLRPWGCLRLRLPCRMWMDDQLLNSFHAEIFLPCWIGSPSVWSERAERAGVPSLALEASGFWVFVLGVDGAMRCSYNGWM